MFVETDFAMTFPETHNTPDFGPTRNITFPGYVEHELVGQKISYIIVRPVDEIENGRKVIRRQMIIPENSKLPTYLYEEFSP